VAAKAEQSAKPIPKIPNIFIFLALFHFVWVEKGEDPGMAEATMEGLP
jgi:hypothetical protein